MKFKTVSFVLLILILTSFSTKDLNDDDQIVGHVVYKMVRHSIQNQNNTPIDLEVKEFFKKIDAEFEAMKLNLFFTKTESLYEIEDALNMSNDEYVVESARMMAGSGCYKNNVTNEKIQQMRSFDEVFNVIKPSDEYKWEISTETKMINGYKCFKATTTKTDHDNLRKRTIEFTPVAWFAPEIPVPFGPAGLDGLPGLILEASFNGTLFYYATNINLDYKKKIKIEKPVKGKYVTEKEFQAIQGENVKKYIR